MIEKLLDVEGPFIGFLDKAGQLIVLSGLWILGCVPIITIGTSTAALYYAVIKSVRRGQGSAVKEFWKSYRANLSRGIPITVTAAALGVLLMMDLGILQGQEKSFLAGGALIGIVLLIFTCIYTGPILSRFHLRITEVWKLAFVMSLRFAHYSLLLLSGTAILIMLQIYVLPIPTALILPGVWCYLTTFLIEKALRRFMPEKEENDNTWYYET